MNLKLEIFAKGEIKSPMKSIYNKNRRDFRRSEMKTSTERMRWV